MELNSNEDKIKPVKNENHCLAIFTPQICAISTFITNHLKYLSPGNTIVFTGETNDPPKLKTPIIFIPYTDNFAIQSQVAEDEITHLFERYQITHILMEYGCEGMRVVEINSRKMHLPIFIHFHGYDASMMLKDKRIVEYYRWMGAVVTGVITVSPKMKSRLREIGIPENKIAIIPYGVTVDEQVNPKIPEIPIRLIAVSRLVAKKGILYLLEAFIKAKQQVPNMILNLIGEGSYRNEIEEFICCNMLKESVILHGAQSHDFVKDMMSGSHIFIQHSITDPVSGDAEGLPNTILEATSIGLPIVSTFHEGIPDAVEHEKTGYLVEEFNVDKMADYIVSLAINPALRKSMGSLGREKMSKEFYLEGQIHKLQKFIRIPKDNLTLYEERASFDLFPLGRINPFISICIFTYNRKKYIGQAIKSALNQSYNNYEIVVVDDGSTEDIKSVVDKFESDKIRFFRKEHTNAPDTRNRCIAEAKGEFILWFADDDILEPDILEEYISTLNLVPEVDIIYSYYRILNEETNEDWLIKFNDWHYNRSSLSEHLLFQPQFMDGGGLFRKSIYDRIGFFNHRFVRAQDYEIAFRIAADESIKLKLVPKPLYIYRRRNNENLSGTMKNKDLRYEWAILDKAFLTGKLHELFDEKMLGTSRVAQNYFTLATRYSQLNYIPKTIEFLEKSIALKADDEAISFLSETRSLLTKLMQKRKEVLSLLKKDKNNSELKSFLDVIDKFTNPFNQNEFFPDDEPLKGYSQTTFDLNIPHRHAESTEISVIIATYNRPFELEKCLNGFSTQTLSKDKFEIVLVDDHSNISIDNVVNKFIAHLPIVYQKHQVNKGLAASRNTGLTIAKGNIVLFFDDDDYPSENYLEEHLKAHAEYPQKNIAVLGYTDWDPDLIVTPVMHHITKVGEQYMAYGGLKPFSLLPWHYFWGGRASIKKSFLDKYGYYDESCRISLEDIELAYRLKEFDLKVLYNPSAVSYMTKPITTEVFCNRCKKQGPGISFIIYKHNNLYLSNHFSILNAEEKVSLLSEEIGKIKDNIDILENISAEKLKDKSGAIIDGKAVNNSDFLNYNYKLLFEYYRLDGFLKAHGNTDSIKRNILDKHLKLDADDYYIEDGFTPPAKIVNITKGKRILIIDDIPPLPDRASGAKDHYQMLMQMIDLGCKVTYVFLAGNAYSDKKAQEYLNFFRLKGVEFIWFKYEVWWNLRSSPQITPILKQLITSLELQSRNFDLVFIAFWQIAECFIDIIQSEIPNTPVIVDSVDIHYIREMRQAELLKDKTFMEEAKGRKKRELAVYTKVDCVKTVTLNDRDELQRYLKNKAVIIMPGAHDAFHSNISFEDRNDFLFIGNFNHLPNGDAVDYFVKDIFPLILKELPETKFYIVGNNPTEKVKSYSSENIIVTGWVPDTKPYLEKCRVSVVPLRYGGGYKGKVCEALSHGLPMVASTIAGEGIGIVNEEHAFVADDAITFARYAVELYNNKQKWEEFSRNGQKLITSQFSGYQLKKRVEYMLSFNSRDSFKSYVAVKFPNPPKVSIIIAAFNQADYTKKCLESIKRFTKVSHEIILIDNASSDRTEKMFPNEINYVRYFRNKSNVGFPAAINQGILQSIGEYVLILNNDTIVTEGWLERMVNAAESDKQTGIVGPISNAVSGVQLDKNASYKNVSELPAYAAKVRKQNADQLIEFPRVAFLCTLIKREVIEKLGGLDERFSPGNFEDDDFCLRAQLAGYKTVIVKDVFIHHYGSKSFTANGIEKYAERLRINEGIFVNKWGANPDEIWIRGKEFKKRNYRFPLNINPATEKYERALINIEEKEYEQALTNLDEAIENFSDVLGMNIRFDQLLNLSGNIALVLNNHEAAKSYFEKELNSNPTSTSACKGLADVFFIKEEFEAAKSLYEWAIKNDPDNLKAVNRLSEVNQLLGLNESHNSLSATKQVSEFDNLFLDAYNHYESGDYKMAMEMVTEAVKHFIPNETMISKEDLYILIGNICLSLNEMESSKVAFETALENNPQSSESCFGLGMIFYQSGQLNEAKIMVEWAIKNDPGNKPAISVLNELNVAIKGTTEIPVENEN
jgi:GT2 family glycosyltransferase/Tfp pilus assembly protein PilF